MVSLPVIDCEGCGRCCSKAGTPPGGYCSYATPGWDGEWMAGWPDYQTWLAMPDALRQELVAYYTALAAGQVEDRAGLELPCMWLDLETMRCRHYEWRPEICRDFEVGSPECLGWRSMRPSLDSRLTTL